MANRFLDQKARVGKRWPYKALDFLPSSQLRRFLAWRSRPRTQPPPFDVAKSLADSDRLLLILPEGLPELLIALPVVQSLFRARPASAIWLLAGPRENSFLAGLFGLERLLILNPDQFLYGEDHFKEMLQRLEALRLEVVINFRTRGSPLLYFLLRMTRAPLRIQVGAAPSAPWSNISLVAGDPPSHLRQYQMAARLWDSAGIPLSGQWGRIVPPPMALERARSLLAAAHLDPAATLIFPWQDLPGETQADLLVRLAAREAHGQSPRAVALLQAEDPLFLSPPPPPAVASAHPVLKADTASTLLALFATTSGTMGMHGPLLLLAGLTDADVTGYFDAKDAPWDTSALNSRLRVERLGDFRE